MDGPSERDEILRQVGQWGWERGSIWWVTWEGALGGRGAMTEGAVALCLQGASRRAWGQLGCTQASFPNLILGNFEWAPQMSWVTATTMLKWAPSMTFPLEALWRKKMDSHVLQDHRKFWGWQEKKDFQPLSRLLMWLDRGLIKWCHRKTPAFLWKGALHSFSMALGHGAP